MSDASDFCRANATTSTYKDVYDGGTASGVIFLTLEDETGVSNVVVWPKVYERFRRIVMGGLRAGWGGATIR